MSSKNYKSNKKNNSSKSFFARYKDNLNKARTTGYYSGFNDCKNIPKVVGSVTFAKIGYGQGVKAYRSIGKNIFVSKRSN